jgi:glycosyltransferase involved in cell wall biosynthesis
MIVVHLTASTFHGGPERQMLGLARALPESVRSVFLSFAEGGRCRPFLGAARQQGCEAVALANDTPHLRAAVAEVRGHLKRLKADVLLCHGYKANLLGRLAARGYRVPAVAVSRGWTGECLKVRLYEGLDRLHLRWMDRVVCVSEAQAAKVRRCRVRPGRLRVIHNAVDPERFADPDARYRAKLARYFRQPRSAIVGAAGRLSPEKGFDVLVAAAERVLKRDPSVGFVLFGEGPCREPLVRQIKAAGLGGAFALSGFRADLDQFLPHLDLLVLPSYTEGLPNVVLEACAAAVPVVATAAGGTPEVVEDRRNGYLVPPGDEGRLADRIEAVLNAEDRGRALGFEGRQRVLERFTFAAQAREYLRLFEELCGARASRPRGMAPPAGPAAEDTRSAEVIAVTPGVGR